MSSRWWFNDLFPKFSRRPLSSTAEIRHPKRSSIGIPHTVVTTGILFGEFYALRVPNGFTALRIEQNCVVYSSILRDTLATRSPLPYDLVAKIGDSKNRIHHQL